MTRTAYRVRLSVVCLALVTIAFVQDPGRIAADTKLDLTLNPWGFLSRALHLWDPMGFFGQVQNQAYGYFFPMGPFFGIGQSLDLPGWVIQRAWWSVVLVTGFLGVVRLARHLGVASPLARVLAGLAYVLGSRYLTTLGPISSETWPAALAPWALVPLASTARMTPRARGLRAAVPILMVGGVNAVATLTTLVLPGMWLLTRRRSRALAATAPWWLLGVGLACAWWVIPLVALRSVSSPFLDWIESSTVTTRFTEVASALRGTTSWMAYVGDPSGPVWGAGWSLVTESTATVGQLGLAALGLVGLARWRGPERWFLCCALTAGLFLVAMGHLGPAQGFAAGWLQGLLDGPLAPFRNTHKFQPIVSLVLCLGLGGVLAEAVPALVARSRRPEPSRTALTSAAARSAGIVSVAVVALVAVSAPAWTGALTRGRSYEVVPGYWREAADWLAREGGHGRALVVPGAPTGDYLWGRSQDEPLQGLAATAWAVRDGVPLSSAGNIRLLDEVEARIGTGHGSAGLTRALARSGVRFLVVRNDLDAVATGAPRRGLVRRALRQSPGLHLRTTVGPPIQSLQTGEIVSPESQELPYAAVEIWEVDAGGDVDRSLAVAGVGLRSLADARVLDGAPESLPGLGDAGMLPDSALFLAGDAPTGISGSTIVTDQPRRTEVAFGFMRNNRTATMTADEDYASRRRVHDYVIDGAATDVRTRTAAVAVTATSSGSRAEVTALGAIDPGSAPGSSLDGDLATAWRSPAGQSRGAWIQWDLPEARTLSADDLRVAFVADGTLGAAPRTVHVLTEAGSADTGLVPSDGLQPLAVAGGQTSWIRLTLLATDPDERAVSFGVRELRIRGLPPSPPGLAVPAARPRDADAVVLSARTGELGACVLVGLSDACDPFLARQGEDRASLRRSVDVPADATVRVRVRPRAGPALDALLATERDVLRIEATSQAVADPAGRAAAAADRDLGTTWVAGRQDEEPALTVRLPERRKVSGLLFLTSPGAPASSPFEVFVDVDGQETSHFARADGSVRFPAVSADRITVRFGFTSPRRGVNPVTGALEAYPVGVGELVVLGADDLRPAADPATPVRVPCGSGPTVAVGEQIVRTAVSTTAGALIDGLVVDATVCDDVALHGGQSEVRADATAGFLVDQVVFRTRGAAAVRSGPATAIAQPVVRAWEPAHRGIELAVVDQQSVLELGENFNPGWRATVAGVALTPVRVDGWRQGWIVPAGASGTVDATFEPDSTYRMGLLLGLIAAVCLVVGALTPPRRSSRRTAPPAAQLPSRLAWALMLGPGLALVAGAAGIGTWIAAIALRPRPLARYWAIGSACLVSAIVTVVWTWPTTVPPAAAWVQAMAATLAVTLAVLPEPGAQDRAARRPTGHRSALSTVTKE
ncbi:MAG: alpha-(1-_3)-arabinofuranosyltransferase family protein [Candidatus Nanopelagicales bacterium]